MYRRIREYRINNRNNNNKNKNNNNNNKNKQTKKIDATINNARNSMINEIKRLERLISRGKRNTPRISKSTLDLCQAEIAHILACTQPTLARGLQPRSLGFSGVHTQPVEVRGSFEVFCGTSGFGFVAIHPRFVNDRDSFTFSNNASTYTGTASSWSMGNGANLAAQPAGQTGIAIKTPYTFSQWDSDLANNNLQGRLISVGVELRYAGTLTDRSGTIISIADPTCRDVTGITVDSAMAQTHAVKYVNNSVDQAFVTVYPRKEFQRELLSDTESLAICLQEFPNSNPLVYFDYSLSATNSKPPAVACFLINAKAGSQFTAEFTAFYEFAGTIPGCLTSAAPYTPAGSHMADNIIHAVHTNHSAKPHMSPADHVSDLLVNRGFSEANKGLVSMQHSKSPYVAGAGFMGAEVMKLAGPSLKKAANSGIHKLLNKIF